MDGCYMIQNLKESLTKGGIIKIYADPEKTDARDLTIIQPYRRYLGRRLPDDFQYWTLAGSVADGAKLSEQSEYCQLTETGLVLPYQFFGIDDDREIILGNRRLAPKANWIHGEFSQCLMDAYQRKTLCPGIVNFDSTEMADAAVKSFERAFCLVSTIPIPMMIVMNVMLSNPRNGMRDERQKIVDEMERNSAYRRYWDRWTKVPEVYVYPGTRPSRGCRTTMGSFLMWKK